VSWTSTQNAQEPEIRPSTFIDLFQLCLLSCGFCCGHIQKAGTRSGICKAWKCFWQGFLCCRCNERVGSKYQMYLERPQVLYVISQIVYLYLLHVSTFLHISLSSNITKQQSGIFHIHIYIYIKVKWSRYRPGVAQRVDRVIALLFHDRGTRSGWVVSSTPRPDFTPGKEPVTTLQEAGWAPEPIWTVGKTRPHWDSIPDRPARSQSLYRLSYPAHYIYIYIGLYTQFLGFRFCR